MRATVVGGSIGGLTAALLLRDEGWDVHVHERSPAALQSRGAGIVVHPGSGALTELHVDGVSEVRPFNLVYNKRQRCSPLQLRLLEFLRAPSELAARTARTGDGRSGFSGR